MVVLSLALIALIFPVIKSANHENIQNVFANKRYRAFSIASNPPPTSATLMMITFPNCLYVSISINALNGATPAEKY